MRRHYLNERLGQLFFVGFEGYTLSRKTKEIIKKIQPGGIVLFECNIKTKNQVKKLIKTITNLLTIKPFIAVDQEGGSVERLRNICTSLPSLWGLSKAGLKELLLAQEIIAKELYELGFNMNFAPVLDINSNPSNPVISTRSISANPKKVTDYGSQITTLFLKHKIIPVIKHFPGHGDLKTDSHLSLPVLTKSFRELSSFELLPFKKAIRNNAPIVMVGHIQLPKIEKDKSRPASLSKNILQGILRNKLHFNGLIITDELNMKGVTNHYSLKQAAYEAINNGANLLLFNTKLDSTFKTYLQVKSLIKKEQILQEKIKDSYEKITFLKNKFLKKRRAPSSPIRTYNNIAEQLSDKVVRIIKGACHSMPIQEIIYPITPKLRTQDLKKILSKLSIKSYKLIPYNLNPDKRNIVNVINNLRKKRKKILITYDIAARIGQKALLKNLLKIEPDLTVISAGIEYDLKIVPKIKNCICAYAPNYASLLAAFKKLLRRD